MNNVLNFMDKIYSDNTTVTIIYVVGALLLFVFILLLIFSLRTPKVKNENIIEEPNIDKTEDVNNESTNIGNEEEKNKDIIIEEKVVEPINTNINDKPKVELSSVLDNAEKNVVENSIEEKIEEPTKISVSSEIPNIDEYVDNVVKKTYEKNEQFSSVYVNDNTNSIKLDKVLNNLNVDEDIKEEIVPKEEKTEDKKEEIKDINITNESNENTNKESGINSLDALKKSLDDKKKEVGLKQEDLKAKLNNLKGNTETKINLDDLASKLNKKD